MPQGYIYGAPKENVIHYSFVTVLSTANPALPVRRCLFLFIRFCFIRKSISHWVCLAPQTNLRIDLLFLKTFCEFFLAGCSVCDISFFNRNSNCYWIWVQQQPDDLGLHLFVQTLIVPLIICGHDFRKRKSHLNERTTQNCFWSVWPFDPKIYYPINQKFNWLVDFVLKSVSQFVEKHWKISTFIRNSMKYFESFNKITFHSSFK